MLVEMDIALRVGDANTFFIKACFHRGVQVEMDPPVVRCVNPWAKGEVDTVVGQSKYTDRRGRVFKYPAFFGEDIFKDLLYMA